MESQLISDNTLNIKIVSTDGNEVFFKIKKTTKLNKLKVSLSDTKIHRASDSSRVTCWYWTARLRSERVRRPSGSRCQRYPVSLARCRSRQPLKLRLLFDGTRIQDDQTAQDLDMEEGDSIEVLLERESLFVNAEFRVLTRPEVGGR